MLIPLVAWLYVHTKTRRFARLALKFLLGFDLIQRGWLGGVYSLFLREKTELKNCGFNQVVLFFGNY